jgi:hypothetical protein
MFVKLRTIFNSLNKPFWVILFFATTSFFYNYTNVEYVKNMLSHNLPATVDLKYGYTYTGPDDFNYVDPAKNFVNGKGYIIDTTNQYLNVRRTPGYSVFYGVHYVIFGEKYSYYTIRFSQCILFGLSVWLLYLTVINLGFGQKIANYSKFIYGFSPFVVGFLFNTITEGIHPASVIALLYFYSLAKVKGNLKYFFIAGLIGAIVILIRPTNILAPMIIGFIFLVEFIQKKLNFKSLAFYALGLFVLWSPWVIRNYQLKHEFIPLEKYYISPTNYGALQLPFERFWMCWGNPRHEYMLNNISFDLPKEDKYATIDQFITEQPVYTYEGISKKDLRNVLIEVSACYKEMYEKRKGLLMYKHTDSVLLCDQKLHDKFELLSKKFAQNAPFTVYVYAPLVVRMKAFIFHSFSSSYPTLNNAGNQPFKWWQVVVKSVFMLLNISLFIALFFSLLYLKKNINLLFLILFPISSMLFYVYYYHIEARYILSSYPFLAVLLAFSLDKLLSIFTRKPVQI